MPLTETAALAKDRRTKCQFEHRHYAAIAGIIHQLGGKLRTQMADHFATQLADTNPRFDRCRFLRACGIMEV